MSTKKQNEIYRLDSYYHAVSTNGLEEAGSSPSMLSKVRRRLSKSSIQSTSGKYTRQFSKANLLNQTVHQAASSDDLKTFLALLEEDETRISQADDNLWTPLHHAADSNSLDVLVILLQRKINVDAVTAQRETALHLAVRAGHCTVIELLVQHGAVGTIKNLQYNTPVHLAVVLKKYDCLKSLLKGGKIDSQVEGEFNKAPFHVAAELDDVKAAHILLEHGAYMCRRCSLGLTALHYAAKNASKNIVELMLEKAEAKGYTRAFLLSQQDFYKHSPLHMAINSGKIEPVKVCLEAGAHIDCKQEDRSTAVHLVCSQPGTLEVLKLMCNSQPDRFADCMNTQDANGMTPLHRAALFDFSDVANFLIQQKSPLNVADFNGMTPLLVAASRQCWDTVNVLFCAGTDFTAKDLESSNFLHLAIRTGGDLTDMWRCSKESQSFTEQKKRIWAKLMNERDMHGCTPLHYASKAGNMRSITGLIDQGAVISCKDNSKQSPLHFASRYGRVNTCRALLDTIQGPYVINESNQEGKTPLHLASEGGHVKVVALLMQSGALLHRDYDGNSPLHLAAKNGFTQTIKLLLNVHSSLLNSENNDKNTPLHEAAITNKPKAIDLLLTMGSEVTENKERRTFLDIAIERSHHEAALAVVNHDRWKEILLLPTWVLGTYTLGFVRYLPDICMAALDRCAESSKHDPVSSDYHVTYHFDLIKTLPDLDSKTPPPPAPSDEEVPANVQLATVPMSILLSMVNFQRVDCLSHPVCLRFIQMKWSKVGFWLNFFNLVVYALFLGCLTATIIMVGPAPLQPNTNQTNSSAALKYEETVESYKDQLLDYRPMLIAILAFIGYQILKEFMQMMQMIQLNTRGRYFTQLSNYIQWIMYITTTLYALPHCMGKDADWTYSCGVCGLFFAWLNLLILLQRFEFFGIYVVMFKEILATLLQVLVVFSILLFAFGVTFFALLRNEVDGGYPTVPLSVFTSIVMMVGDMNYMDTFVRPLNDNDSATLRFSVMAFFIMSLFLLFVPILLMNLLIGLAVGDIEGVQKNARLKRLAMQVQLMGGMEKKMPKFILRMINKDHITVYPNNPCGALVRWYEALVQGSNKDQTVTSETQELQTQIAQQKARLKSLQTEMAQQTELLKLVVAKMEIHTESSVMDEGSQDESRDIAIILKQAAARSNKNWKQKSITDAVTKSQVVSVWHRESQRNIMTTGIAEGRCITPVEADHVETNL